MSRVDWSEVLDQAASIVSGYSTGVTLRQLHYRLVSVGVIPNTTSAYKTLSARTAEARRDGWFPSLVDRTRSIHLLRYVEDPTEALDDLVDDYRRDRTEGQDTSIYVGVEKNALAGQLRSWFQDLGIPIVALGGYSSQTYCDEISASVARDGRPAVLIYGGDFDPSGEDIQRDFENRTDLAFEEIIRVALHPEQIEEFDLPPQPGKATDTRAGSFVARHGQLVQVELDALPPDVLRTLYQDAIDRFWDTSKFQDVIEQEERERAALAEFRDQWDDLGLVAG